MHPVITEINYDSPQVEKLFLINCVKYQQILADKISFSDVQFISDFDWTISKPGWMKPYTGSNNRGSSLSAIEMMPIMNPAQIKAKNAIVKRISELEQNTSAVMLEEKQKVMESLFLEE